MLLYVGRFAGPLSLLLIGDLFGRKLLFVVSLGVSLVAISVVPFSPSLMVAGVFLCLAMFGAANISFLSFNFLAECVS